MVAHEPGNTDLDPMWVEFLQTKVDTFAKWDLVRFFHDNPHMIDTAENIARYMARDLEQVQHELKGLVSADVLSMEVRGQVEVYRLTENEKIRTLIQDFIAACHDYNFRRKAIDCIIHGMNYHREEI
ncbi:MAG: hypothetical protein D6712_05960 [Chloroflexi bacterium]|nr:MAG: hypothetical protein D6712_05960 [Chloroflexota bacterium]